MGSPLTCSALLCSVQHMQAFDSMEVLLASIEGVVIFVGVSGKICISQAGGTVSKIEQITQTSSSTVKATTEVRKYEQDIS